MPLEQISLLEGGSFANMEVDANGNLYIPDFDNHRLLRYDTPFETDTQADYVWGQIDFIENECNRGRGVDFPDNQSLCLRSPFNEGFAGGAGIDPTGHLWVTDNQNNRVLRFPYDTNTGVPTITADLVLGQPDFTSWMHGEGMQQMWAPLAVRIDSNGSIYVADSLNNRVLVFDPPPSSGMAATRILGSGLRQPYGLELDPGGGIWVSDRENNQLLLFESGVVTRVLFKDLPDYSGTCRGSYSGDGPLFYSPGDDAYYDSFNVCGSGGSIGIDRDGNIFVSASNFVQDVWRFPAPLPDPQPGIAHSADARLFMPYQFGVHNEIGLAGIYSARGVAIAANQLIVSDMGRLLFWDDPPDLTNGQPADGYTGAPSPSVHFQPHFTRISTDSTPRLWAIRGSEIQVYAQPMVTGASSIHALNPPLPVLGGGSLDWDGGLAIGGIALEGNGEKLWVADPIRNRVFRVSDPVSSPLVDIILGQNNLDGTLCNQGLSAPTQNSLYYPGSVTLDPWGNIFVADHSLEVSGNFRLLEFDASLFPS